MGIVIARYYGARNFTKIKEAVAATWILGALLSIVVMLMGFVGLYPLLQYLDTPAEILPQSYQYISMIVTCVGVSFAYNLFAGLLRSIGDSLAALGFSDFFCLGQCGAGFVFHYATASGSSICGACYHHLARLISCSLLLLYP